MSLRVAFASSDRQHVDQHFGAARAFVVHSIDAAASHVVEVVEFIENPMDAHDGKLAGKVDLLAGCVAVYCQAVGASAVQRLLAKGIQPVKVDEGAAIERLISGLQHEMRNGPAGWLAKAERGGKGDRGDGAREDSRFAAMENEGWEE